MQTIRTFRPTRLAALTVALVASASCLAGGGEALDVELPSMRSPVQAPAAIVMTAPALAVANQEAALANTSTFAAASFGVAPTREQVRAQLKEARANRTLSLQGEAGDTSEVLAARERFNSQQSDAIVAEYVADQQRNVALAAAELRRSEIEAESLLAQHLALQGGYALPDNSAAIADETEVRIDVVDVDASRAAMREELVVVSVEGGDEAAQRERALTVRRELGELGVAPGQIYVESGSADNGASDSASNSTSDSTSENREGTALDE